MEQPDQLSYDNACFIHPEMLALPSIRFCEKKKAYLSMQSNASWYLNRFLFTWFYQDIKALTMPKPHMAGPLQRHSAESNDIAHRVRRYSLVTAFISLVLALQTESEASWIIRTCTVRACRLDRCRFVESAATYEQKFHREDYYDHTVVDVPSGSYKRAFNPFRSCHLA